MIFVTGGTGLVGTRLLFDLLSDRKSEKITALKRKSSDLSMVAKSFSFYGNKKLLDKIEWVNGDILDKESLIDLIKGYEQVYHSAALISFNPSDKQKMFETNVIGTRNIVDACIENNIKKLCYVSSVAALGDGYDNEIIDENTMRQLERSHSGYSDSKYEGELEIWRGIEEGLNAVIVNPSIILGIGDYTKGSSQLFGRIAKGLKYYTESITGFVDVRDVSNIMIKLMEGSQKNERFILNSENLSIKIVFDMIAAALNVKPPNRKVKAWMTELAWRLLLIQKHLLFKQPKFTKRSARALHKNNYFSAKKIINELGIEFIPVEQSVNDYSEFYKTKS